MNRRRKVGSTFLLSSLAALSIVGMGLAAGLVSGSSSFDIIFTDNTKPTYGSVTVTDEDSIDLEVALNDDGQTIGFTQDIQFTFNPGEDAPANVVLNIDASFTADEGTDVTQYLTIGNPSLTLEADVTRAEPVTFTLKKDALNITLANDVTFEAAKAGLEGKNAKVKIDYAIAEKETEPEPQPEPTVSSVALDKETIDLTVGEGTDTLTATVTMDPAGSAATAVEWSFSDGYETYISVTGTDSNTITITPVAEGSVTVTAKAGDKTDTATINVKAAPVVEEPDYTAYADVKAAEDGTWVTVRGEVTAVMGNSAYITDGSDGLYVYNISNAGWKMGKEYEIHAQVDIYNDYHQLTGYQTSGGTASVTLLADDVITASPIALDEEGFKALTTADVGKVYTFDAQYISGTPSTGNAVSTTWKIGSTEVTLRTERYDDVGISEELVPNAFYTVTTPLSWYSGNPQFVFVGQGTTLVKKDVELTSITISGPTEVAIGSEIQLTATPNTGASLGEVTWAIAPEDAELAAIDQTGKLTGKALGEVNVTATSKTNEAISGSYVVEVKNGDDVTPEPYVYTFESKPNVTNEQAGTLELNGVTWSYDAAAYFGIDSNNDKGFQIGSSSNPITTWTISANISEFVAPVKEVIITAATASSGNATLSVYIDEQTIEESPVTLQTGLTDFSFAVDPAASEGVLKIQYDNSAKKAVYLKTIKVVF